SVQAMKDLENRPPVTAEDYLYLGRATAMLGDPDQGLKLLDEAIRRRPSALAHILRAWVRTDWVNSRADPALAERAIEDVQFTKTLLAHNRSRWTRAHIRIWQRRPRFGRLTRARRQTPPGLRVRRTPSPSLASWTGFRRSPSIAPFISNC